MSFLRRTAVRAILAQPTRQFAISARFSTRVTTLPSSRACAIRGFHQSRLVRAEEERKEAEEASPVEVQASDETVPVEPRAEEALSSPDAVAPAPPKHTVFVANLSWDTTTAKLEQEFSSAGEVLSCHIPLDPRGIGRGFAFVDFATSEAAETAIEQLNQSEIDGRQIFVKPNEPREGQSRRPRVDHEYPPSKTLFIGNLSYDMSDRDLNELFRSLRNVVDVRVAIDRRSGQPRGFGHVDFIDIASAEKGKEYLESKEVMGRKLRVGWGAAGAKRPSDYGGENDRYRQRGDGNRRPYQRREGFGSERRPYQRREHSGSDYSPRDNNSRSEY